MTKEIPQQKDNKKSNCIVNFSCCSCGNDPNDESKDETCGCAYCFDCNACSNCRETDFHGNPVIDDCLNFNFNN
jgi:hypothetical protein